jgi:hypothetical protein
MEIIVLCRFGQVKTVNRAGIDADPAGHAGYIIEPRFFPQRSFYRWRENPKGVLHRRLRTDASAGAAFNAPLSSNDMKRILISRYCINRA